METARSDAHVCTQNYGIFLLHSGNGLLWRRAGSQYLPTGAQTWSRSCQTNVTVILWHELHVCKHNRMTFVQLCFLMRLTTFDWRSAHWYVICLIGLRGSWLDVHKCQVHRGISWWVSLQNDFCKCGRTADNCWRIRRCIFDANVNTFVLFFFLNIANAYLSALSSPQARQAPSISQRAHGSSPSNTSHLLLVGHNTWGNDRCNRNLQQMRVTMRKLFMDIGSSNMFLQMLPRTVMHKILISFHS